MPKIKVRATADFFDRANQTQRKRGQEFDLKDSHVNTLGKLVEPVLENKQKSEKEIKIEESRKKYQQQNADAQTQTPKSGLGEIVEKVNPGK